MSDQDLTREIRLHPMTLTELRGDPEPFDPAELDDGIRDVVVAMRAAGLPTHDSGDGTKTVEQCEVAMDFPHVVAHVEPSERFAVGQAYLAWALAHGASPGEVHVEWVGEEHASIVFLHADQVVV